MTDTSDEAIKAMKKFLTGTGVIYAQGNLWAWDISSMLSALRDERNALRTKLAWWDEQSREMLEAVEKAEDERDRLREALEKIGGITMSMCLNYKDMAETQRDIARTALKEDRA